MSKNREKTIKCPVEKTLNIIGKKWAILIIRDLLSGKKRFGQLLTSLAGISPRTLSARLYDLEKNGVLAKKVFSEIPLRTEYSLTKKGKSLYSILDQMNKWGSSHK